MPLFKYSRVQFKEVNSTSNAESSRQTPQGKAAPARTHRARPCQGGGHRRDPGSDTGGHGAPGRSEDEVRVGVDLLEGLGGALVEDSLGVEALVLVEVIGAHAGPETSEVDLAELLENGLSGRALILSGEATGVRVNGHTY